jgi:hypothetical protein
MLIKNILVKAVFQRLKFEQVPNAGKNKAGVRAVILEQRVEVLCKQLFFLPRSPNVAWNRDDEPSQQAGHRLQRDVQTQQREQSPKVNRVPHEPVRTAHHQNVVALNTRRKRVLPAQPLLRTEHYQNSCEKQYQAGNAREATAQRLRREKEGYAYHDHVENPRQRVSKTHVENQFRFSESKKKSFIKGRLKRFP